MNSPKRIQRPRLERRKGSDISAYFDENDMILDLDYRCLSLRDIKRLAKFLPRAIAYLESRRGKGAR